LKDKRKEAKRLFERAIELDPEMMCAYYGLACWCPLEGKKTRSFEFLEKVMKKGFCGRAWIDADHDIDGLRADPMYLKLMSEYFAAGSSASRKLKEASGED